MYRSTQCHGIEAKQLPVIVSNGLLQLCGLRIPENSMFMYRS
jgi:hypothetical protein